MQNDILNIGGESFHSRLFIGTGKFSSGEILQQTIESSATQLVTVAMKRANPNGAADSIIDFIPQDRVKILPNTSECAMQRKLFLWLKCPERHWRPIG